MKIGKVPETVLKRSVFKQIRHRRPEVLVGANVGEDCAVVGLLEDEVVVLSTDPITGAAKDIGKLAIHITANDIVTSGAQPVGVLLTILLPDNARESDLRELMKEIDEVCKDLNIEVIGGHTEVTDAVNKPVVTVTGVGKMKKSEILTTRGMKTGQEIVMTKWAGLEGTAIIAAEHEEELNTRYAKEWIDSAKEMINHISVVKDALIAKEIGVTAMHDATEGGIFGALWEMAAASNKGVTVDLKKILVRQETIEICEFYDLNPYLLISSGCLLMSTDKGNVLVDALRAKGIPAQVIGIVTDSNERIVVNEEEKRYLEPPKSDELYKVKERAHE